ncbi:MAG: hypothetical protein IPL61_12555 [Myxococcales bacterium]|nr:hypothetical protein [Myxococcales bacterium]
MIPAIVDVAPLRGTTLGFDLVRIQLRNAAPNVALTINDRPVASTGTKGETVRALTFTMHRLPDAPGAAELWVPMLPRLIDRALIAVMNLTPGGTVVAGARAEWDGVLAAVPGSPAEVRTAAITRAVASALRTFAAPAARFAFTTDLDLDNVRMVPLSDGPALTLAGPRLDLARVGTTERPIRETVLTDEGERRRLHPGPVSVDLTFTLTGTSRNPAEAVALMAAVSTFIARTRWLELPEDPRVAGLPLVRWDVDADGAFAAEVVGGVPLFRTRVRVRDVAMAWPSSMSPPCAAST